jgi:hypothetical protein
MAGQQAFVVGAGGALAGAANSQSLKGTAWGAAWGAVSALTFYGIGSYFEGASWATSGKHVFGTNLNYGGFASKVLAHGVAGGALQHLQGGRFGSGFAAAGITQAFSGAIDGNDPANPSFPWEPVLAAALLGGAVSDLTGGKFAHGAVTAAFARAFNDQASRKSLAQRMRGEFLVDGSRGVSINLFDRSDGNWARAEKFPVLDDVVIVAGHADPSQPVLIDNRVDPPQRYEASNAANELIRAGLKDGGSVLVLGCGAGASGFMNRLYNELQGRGVTASITGPTELTGFGIKTVGTGLSSRQWIYFPQYENANRTRGPDSRVPWATVGGDRP